MVIYSIGHSNNPFEHFKNLLKKNGVNLLIDARSIPASRFYPAFNKKALSTNLPPEGIDYFYPGKMLGGKIVPEELYDEEGNIDPGLVFTSEYFLTGIDAVKAAAEQGSCVAVMCAEADPLDCHRFYLISNILKQQGYDIIHIHKNGTTETQQEAEERMMKKYLPERSLFDSDEEALREAYRMLIRKVGYKRVK